MRGARGGGGSKKNKGGGGRGDGAKGRGGLWVTERSVSERQSRPEGVLVCRNH